MGQPIRVPVIVKWLKIIHQVGKIKIFKLHRKFWQILNCLIYTILNHLLSPVITFTLKGFTTILTNRIDENKNYINFRKVFLSCSRPSNKRQYEYIILHDNKIHLNTDDLKVNQKRKSVTDTVQRISPPHKPQQTFKFTDKFATPPKLVTPVTPLQLLFNTPSIPYAPTNVPSFLPIFPSYCFPYHTDVLPSHPRAHVETPRAHPTSHFKTPTSHPTSYTKITLKIHCCLFHWYLPIFKTISIHLSTLISRQLYIQMCSLLG